MGNVLGKKNASLFDGNYTPRIKVKNGAEG